MTGPPAGWTPYSGPAGTRPPPSHTNLVLWIGLGGAAVVAVILVVLLVLPSLLAVPPGSASLVIRQDTDGGYSTGSGGLAHCGSGIVSSADSSWICLNASVDSVAGYARGWYQFQSDFNRTDLSGVHTYAAVGDLQLAAGFASVKGACAGDTSAFARIYIFWHVWVYDETAGVYIDQSDSGYLWDSGTQYCNQSTNGALPTVTSPAISGPVSGYAAPNGIASFQAGHQYRFTFFLGCTGEASLSVDNPGTWVAAGCNVGSPRPAQNTFVETGVSIS